MKLLFTFSLIFVFSILIFPQSIKIPSYFKLDKDFSDSLLSIVKSVGLDGDFEVGEDGIEQISFCVIDLNHDKPVIGGVNYDNFIYPTSVYKMYVAAEILSQVSRGEYSLYKEFEVKAPNDVDRSKEIKTDPRPLLKNGDTVTVNYLLDLMITRSDNSAANCLIDIASRNKINKFMEANGWQGSEVTRKFLSRKFEDPGYEDIRGTETNALHAADFMYKIYKSELINPWVSMQLKTFLGRQLDKSKLAQGLPADAMYFHKTGWWSYWTNDVGIVDDGNVKYVIALFTPLEEDKVQPKLKELSQKVYELINRLKKA